MTVIPSSRPGELVVELVQMTPMIHFQAIEKGATLRATEVKPKLDRYLLHAAFHDNKAEYSKYLISSDPRNEEAAEALDYRLVIMAEPANVACYPLSKKDTAKNIYKNHTGSIWESDKPVYGTLIKQGKTVKLIFRSRHKALISFISQWVDAFFASENFGRRQSKGYGSFLTVETAKSFSGYEQALKKHMLQTEWFNNRASLSVHCAYRNKVIDWEQALNEIRGIHKMMKSGEIRPILDQNKQLIAKLYTPSYLLKDYSKNQEKLKRYTNEKKAIKTELLLQVKGLTLPEIKSHSANDNSDTQEKRFFRALLGLSQFYEFRKLRYNGREYMARISIEENVKKDENVTVARFRSPITYKPVCIDGKWYIFLIPVWIPDEMYGRSFRLSIAQTKENDCKNIYNAKFIHLPNPVVIKTPTKDEFDLLHFLDSYSNDEQVVQKQWDRYSKTEIITKCSFRHITINKEVAQNE